MKSSDNGAPPPTITTVWSSRTTIWLKARGVAELVAHTPTTGSNVSAVASGVWPLNSVNPPETKYEVLALPLLGVPLRDFLSRAGCSAEVRARIVPHRDHRVRPHAAGHRRHRLRLDQRGVREPEPARATLTRAHLSINPAPHCAAVKKHRFSDALCVNDADCPDTLRCIFHPHDFGDICMWKRTFG